MKFIADENFPFPSVEILRKAGHDVFSIAEDLTSIADELILSKAAEEERIILTNDKDFGDLIF